MPLEDFRYVLGGGIDRRSGRFERLCLFWEEPRGAPPCFARRPVGVGRGATACKARVGVTGRDDRLSMEAVLFHYRAGIPWRDLPERDFPAA